MRLLKLAMAVSIILVIDTVAGAQDAVERLQPLVATSARRLAIAKQVAFVKWDSQASVENVAREAVSIPEVIVKNPAQGAYFWTG